MNLPPLKNLLLWLWLWLIFIIGCSYDPLPHLITENEFFTIELPEYLKKEKDLTNDTPIQYGNKFRNLYLVVIERDKNEFANLKSFSDIYIHKMEEGVPDCIWKSENHLSINNMPTYYLETEGTVGTEKLFERISYHMTFIEGEYKYYHLSIWHWAATDHKYKGTIQTIFGSFKEKNKNTPL